MSGDGWNKTDGDDASNETHNSISSKKNNVLPLWGNERTMNLNNLILTNIQSSHYFKVNLYELKTYHEVIDEIYYKVQHLEPWEKGSRKTSGQTGMCGGVRGVGAGGIVSTAYCLLYKLFTLKLTRKQLNGLINHTDSPYIRALGFMYIRYTQPPADLWDWYEEYLEDEEEVDAKAGGGQTMTIGIILRSFLTKLEWFSTLFPRIPVPIQQKIEKKMSEKFPVYSQTGSGHVSSGGGGGTYRNKTNTSEAKHIPDNEAYYGEAERNARLTSKDSQDKYKKYDNRSYDNKRSYDSKDDKYKSTNRYASPERKKYKDEYSRSKDDYSRSRDDYSRSKDDYVRSRDDYSRSRDDTSRRKDDYSRSSRDDKHYSSRDKYDKYSSRDKDRSRKYDDERERSHRKY